MANDTLKLTDQEVLECARAGGRLGVSGKTQQSFFPTLATLTPQLRELSALAQLANLSELRLDTVAVLQNGPDRWRHSTLPGECATSNKGCDDGAVSYAVIVHQLAGIAKPV